MHVKASLAAVDSIANAETNLEQYFMNPTLLPGVHVAPNIQVAPDVYEIENRAADPDHLIEAAMWRVAPWQGQLVVDLGAGTGFHIPHFHELAAHVIGIEPHGPSRLRAMERCSALELAHVSLMTGSAEQVWLPDHHVDMVHARFAYFWGAGSEAGVRELQRILRPGGTAFIIDNNLRQGTFATWLQRVDMFAKREPDSIDQFWQDNGFARTEIVSEWRFQQRQDLEAVIHNEFPPLIAETILSEQQELHLSYVYNLYFKQF